MYRSGQEEPYLSFINNMNEEISKANALVKSRQTRRQNNIGIETDV